jgi:hypothetical protein
MTPVRHLWRRPIAAFSGDATLRRIGPEQVYSAACRGPRGDNADIEQTVDEEGGWLQTQRVRLFEKEPPRRTFKPGSPEYHYANVQYWLDAYEDQHPYLSSEMPKRQRREVDREGTKELLDRFFPKRS